MRAACYIVRPPVSIDRYRNAGWSRSHFGAQGVALGVSPVYPGLQILPHQVGSVRMHFNLYVGFAITSGVLILIPGPNVSLIVANSIAYGTRYGLLTVAGTSTAIVLQLALTALGLSATLGVLAGWFEWIRWAGVAYLLYLGFRQWTAAHVDLMRIWPQQRSFRVIALRGFAISLTNPKTLLFYGAFFPQFLSNDAPIAPQVALLSLTFFAIAAGLDSCWALLAGRLRGLLAVRGRLRNRLSGGFLMGAGVGLALAHRE
jgi:threonine/homoserine/homoserine lactone efflux protein